MKRLIIISGILFLTFCECKKDNNTYDVAVITGPDNGECICCGGWFISINNSVYEFWTPPTSTNIDLEHATFPMYVKVGWQKTEKGCRSNLITVNYLWKQ
jgi:hypothetical protein